MFKKRSMNKKLFHYPFRDVVADVAGVLIIVIWLQLKLSAGVFIPAKCELRNLFRARIDSCCKGNIEGQFTFHKIIDKRYFLRQQK